MSFIYTWCSKINLIFVNIYSFRWINRKSLPLYCKCKSLFRGYGPVACTTTSNRWNELHYVASKPRWISWSPNSLLYLFTQQNCDIFGNFLAKDDKCKISVVHTSVSSKWGQTRLFSHHEPHCVWHMAWHAQVVFLFYQLRCLCSCRTQNALCMIAVFIFQIQYIAPSLKPSHFLFMPAWRTSSFFPRDIYFCQVHLHSLESNPPECFPSFSSVLSPSVPFPSNNTFYHSKVFFNQPPWF